MLHVMLYLFIMCRKCIRLSSGTVCGILVESWALYSLHFYFSQEENKFRISSFFESCMKSTVYKKASVSSNESCIPDFTIHSQTQCSFLHYLCSFVRNTKFSVGSTWKVKGSDFLCRCVCNSVQTKRIFMLCHWSTPCASGSYTKRHY